MLMPIMISMTRSYHNPRYFYRLSSVSSFPRTKIFSLALLLLLGFITGCEEKPTMIGSNLLPGSDFVNIKDTTLTCEAYTHLADSINTLSALYSYLGEVADPYFGVTKTDFVAQLRLQEKWSATELPIIDSVKLFLDLLGAKGTLDTTVIHQMKIYEITEDLVSTNKYFSNRDPHAGTELATVTLPTVKKDTIQSLEMRLPNSVGERLLSDTSKLSQDSEGNPFKTFFKGVYVTMVDSPSRELFAMSFETSNFGISVYFHDSQGTTGFYNFVVNSNSLRYNRYTYNYTSATAARKVDLQKIKNKTKDTLIYLQAFNGVYPQVKLNGLNAIRNMLWDPIKKVPRGAVNKARLTFSVLMDDPVYTSTTVPSQIYLKYFQSDSSIIVPDYYVNSAFFDGTFNSAAKTYSFNLASFIQEYIKGHITDSTVYMFFPEGEYNNVILRANNSPTPVKFEFIYTRL
jgi:hypothetical protein